LTRINEDEELEDKINLEKKARAFEAAGDIVDYLFENMEVLMQESAAIASCQDTAKKTLKSLLTGATTVGLVRSDQKVQGTIQNNIARIIDEVESEEPQET